MNMFNMAELYRQSQKIKNDSNREEILIGEVPRLKPHLPIGPATGVITNIATVKGDSWTYVKFGINFSLEGREKPVLINKNIFISRSPESEFVKTMRNLLEDFVPGKVFSSRDLEGLVVDVEINHKQIENGEVAEISKIYGLHQQSLTEFEM